MSLKNNVRLIVYPDSLGSDLVELHYVLRRYLSKAIGGVHLLPFYPSSADRGFAPLTYDEVEPMFGTWRDVNLIGKEFDLIIDFMVNHISRQSVYFQDYFEKGPESEYTDMFLSFNKFSPTGEVSDEDLEKVYTRKPRPPYTTIQRADGSKENVWYTFDYEQITTLDTHDGIGVVDVQDMLTPEEMELTLEGLDEKGANTRKVFSGPEYRNLDIYQVNCTYYSALECNDDSYIAARAIQFFTPGIPQVYYVGLLAGANDIELAQQTKNGRDINRHNYTLDEIAVEIKKPVVKRLLRLMEFRTNYPVFDGRFAIENAPDDEIRLSWEKEGYEAALHVDLRKCTVTVS